MPIFRLEMVERANTGIEGISLYLSYLVAETTAI